MAEPFGPFFDVELHEPGAAPGGPWRPLSELVDEPAALVARVEQVQRALDTTEVKVAASVAQLGLIARLISPAFAAAVTGAGPTPTLAETWWQPELGGAFPLSLAAETGSVADVVTGPVRELTQAVLACYPVSATVLRGNIASAVQGAAGIVSRARPELAPRARAVAAGLLDLPWLHGTFELRQGRFVRRSCCLIYRVAGGRTAVCGDCVLA